MSFPNCSLFKLVNDYHVPRMDIMDDGHYGHLGADGVRIWRVPLLKQSMEGEASRTNHEIGSFLFGTLLWSVMMCSILLVPKTQHTQSCSLPLNKKTCGICSAIHERQIHHMLREWALWIPCRPAPTAKASEAPFGCWFRLIYYSFRYSFGRLRLNGNGHPIL